MLDEASVRELRGRMRGSVITPRDPGYDEAHRTHQGMFDQRRPALIARCLGTADVADAVRFARAHDLELAVRGGGHGLAGYSVCDGGSMLDLSLMRGVQVDPRRRIARAAGGATWGDFNRETQLHGLASTGGIVSTTGVAGLTLGGGLGWLMGKHGLAVDNLIAAEVVTATGDVVRASAEEEPDLFWGLRGGGGNFGVASWLEFGLHPLGPVTSGFVAHPIERARDVLRLFRELIASAPDELTLHAGLTHTREGLPVSAIVGCHSGSLAEGEAATQRIKRFGAPLTDTLGPTSYVDTNTLLFDWAFPKGARNYWKSGFVTELPDAAIDVLADQFAVCPSSMSGIFFEHIHGAVVRVGAGATAFPQRRECCTCIIASEWRDPQDDEKNILWARDAYAALRPFMIGVEAYTNYMSGDEPQDARERSYGASYARLAALKRRFDPTNVFHLNQNVRPAA